MRLQEEDLVPEVMRTMLKVLTGDPSPGSLRHDGALLYLCSGRADFMKQMPSFDEWGLRPAGLRGPRENPVAAVALPVAQSGPVSGDGAGRREPPGAEGDDVEVLTSHGALKAASPEARPGAVAGEELQLMAPEARASDAPAAPHEALPGGIPRQVPLAQITLTPLPCHRPTPAPSA